MKVHLTPDQKALAQQAIEAGRLRSEEDVVAEALALWEERERQKAEFLLSLKWASESLDRGEGYTVTDENLAEFTQGIKDRGRERLLRERPDFPGLK